MEAGLVRCRGTPGAEPLVRTRVIAQVRLNRAEVGRRDASRVGPVTNPALLTRLHDLPPGMPVYDPMSVRSCAKEDEALPRIFGHAVDLCHKVEVPAAMTCADGHG